MNLETATRTDVGRKRERNEDTVMCHRLTAVDGWLLGVADGMGGHAAGDVASQTAVEIVQDYVDSEFTPDGEARSVLGAAIDEANDELRALRAADPSRGEMGTTFVAALVTDDGVTVANVGDSRAYLVDDEINQVTTDQTVVHDLVERGSVSETDAADHPQRHVLSQALGPTNDVDPDFHAVTLAGRTLVLCSDGLTEEVSDRTIRTIVMEASDPAAAANQLVDRANENGGSDNISVVIAQES